MTKRVWQINESGTINKAIWVLLYGWYHKPKKDEQKQIDEYLWAFWVCFFRKCSFFSATFCELRSPLLISYAPIWVWSFVYAQNISYFLCLCDTVFVHIALEKRLQFFFELFVLFYWVTWLLYSIFYLANFYENKLMVPI